MAVKMNKYHFVYITTNTINGKQYVGDHSTNNINDHYLGSGKAAFKPAIDDFKEAIKQEQKPVDDKTMFEREFVEWILSNGLSYNRNNKILYWEDRFTLNELHDYWINNVKGK